MAEIKVSLGTKTPKVVAMRIAAGQEHRVIEIEENAKHFWMNIEWKKTHKNLVFVSGPQQVFSELSKHLVAHDLKSGTQHVWLFQHRSEADKFVQHLIAHESLSYWQVAESARFAPAGQMLLLGACHNPYPQEPGFLERRLEQARAIGLEVLSNTMFSGWRDLSIVLVDLGILFSRKLPGISLGDLAGSREQSEGTADFVLDKVGYFVFHKHDAARMFFAKAAEIREGSVWHFAKAF